MGYAVNTDIDGRTYSGTYRVKEDTITVTFYVGRVAYEPGALAAPG